MILCVRWRQQQKPTKKHLMYGNRIGFWLKPHGPSRKMATEKCKSVKTISQRHLMQHAFCTQRTNGSRSVLHGTNNNIIMSCHSQQTSSDCTRIRAHVFTRSVPSQTETLKFLPGKVFCQRGPGRMAGSDWRRRPGRAHISILWRLSQRQILSKRNKSVKRVTMFVAERRSVDERIYFN